VVVVYSSFRGSRLTTNISIPVILLPKMHTAMATHLTQRKGCGPGSGLVLYCFHQSQADPATNLFWRSGPLRAGID
jgi:hypothetical protein